MTTRWSGVLLLALAFTASGSRAEWDLEPIPAATDRPSHKPINDGLENDLTPEQRLANRLQKSRQQKGMQELAKRLLEDKDLLNSLRENFAKNKLSERDIERLKRTVEANRDFAADPALQELLKEGLKGKNLTEQERELVDKWKDTLGKNNSTLTPPKPPEWPPQPGKLPPAPPQPGGATQPGATPVQPPAPGTQSLPKETPEWLKKSLDGSARDFTKWLDSPSGKSFRDGLKDFGKDLGKRAGNVRDSAAGERFRGASKYLPRPGNWMFDNVRPRTAPRVGSLPRLPSPSSSSVPRVSGGGLLRFVIVVAAIALLLFVAWKSRGLWAGALMRGRSSEWRLGPWPVRPDQVSARGDLVAAFEHLALMCLGLPARTHHHLDLARQIAEQPSLDPDRRRDAALTLARLYEQARYTPDDEPLSPQDVAAARRELGYLAGEMAA
jgi:hypothetical protein